MPGLDRNRGKRTEASSDETTAKKKKTPMKTKLKVVQKKKKTPSKSKITRPKRSQQKEPDDLVEIQSKEEKKEVPKRKKISKKMTEEVLNGSLSEKRTGEVYLGFHASSSGGVHNAIRDSVTAGARSLALFLRPQRTWSAPPLKSDAIQQFVKIREEEQILPNMVLPHGSYLLNLGSPDLAQREKSLETLVDELERCQVLGIMLFNIHPGSATGKISRAECIGNIADGINAAHQRTEGSSVRIVLENMSCQGNTIGGDLRELKQIIDLVENKKRVGVCLDTCHAMAAGYDLSCQEGFDRMIREFGSEVGWEWLLGCHINDSQGPAGCHADRHQNIGKGTIGLEGFRRILNCPHFTDIPLILETPLSQEHGFMGYKAEMDLLLSLIDKKK